MMHGEILCSEDYKGKLEDIGVTVGEYVGYQFIDCKVPDESFRKLDLLWGEIFWSLREEDK